MVKTIKSRINDLENQNPKKPFKAVFRDWDNHDLWHDRPQTEGVESYTWDEIEARYSDYDLLQVWYTTDWRDEP